MLKISKRLIDITAMRDIIQRRIPVLTLDSKKPGPTVWLSACIHGDEPGGAVIVHDVFQAVRDAGMRGGVLHGLPLVNSMGFENVSRYINSDREDLNRCFPGDPRGTMGERIAQKLFDVITKSKPDLVIDLHNDWIQSVPYVLIEPQVHYSTVKLQQTTLKIARAAGLLMVQDSDTSPGMARTLTAALVAAGISAFTIEAGGAGGIVESSVAAGKSAILGLLRQIGVIDASLFKAAKPDTVDLLDYTNKPLCTSSGLVRFAVAPGDVVKTDQKVAQVYSAFGSLEETLRATGPGYVLGVADHARAVPGSEVIAIAELTAQ